MRIEYTVNKGPLYLNLYLDYLGMAPTSSAPSSPHLSAAQGPQEDEVTLKWSPPEYRGSAAIHSYHVYRAQEGAFERITTLDGSGRDYVDRGLSLGLYRYFVTAESDAGEGDESGTVVGFAMAVPTLTTDLVPIAKLADIGTSEGATATMTVESGTLRTQIARTYLDVPVIVPRANGLPNPASLNQNVPPVSTTYTVADPCHRIAGTCQLTLGHQAGTDFVKVGEVWQSRLDVIMDGQVIQSSPFVEVRT